MTEHQHRQRAEVDRGARERAVIPNRIEVVDLGHLGSEPDRHAIIDPGEQLESELVMTPTGGAEITVAAYADHGVQRHAAGISIDVDRYLDREGRVLVTSDQWQGASEERVVRACSRTAFLHQSVRLTVRNVASTRARLHRALMVVKHDP